MTVDASLQIRKLPPSHISQLSIILEFSEQWKKLMAVIPNKLQKGSFECYINCENPAKYNGDHMRLIEAASLKYKKTGTEILLDEWGCSGRIRPSVGHLLHLLLKAELYRAADYVSEKILCRTSTERPSLGPAARIHVNRNIEEDLNNMKYSSSLIDKLNFSSFNNNLDYEHEEISSIPQIVVTPDADESAQIPNFQEEKNETKKVVGSLPNPINFSKEERISSNESDNLTDIKSSPVENESNAHMPYIPQISSLLSNNSVSENSIDQSVTTSLNESNEDMAEFNNITTPFIPNLSKLNLCAENLDESFQNNNESSFNVPNLSALNESVLLDDSFSLKSMNNDGLIPDLSVLNQSENLNNLTENCDTSLPNLNKLNHSTTKSLRECDNAVIPNISCLNQSGGSIQNSANSSSNISTYSVLNQSSKLSKAKENSSSVDLPDISGLIQMSSQESYDSTFSDLQDSAEIVHINSTCPPKIENSNVTMDYETDNSLPNLNLLISESSRLTVSTFDSSKSRKCNSPLPNLTLTTHLPHFTYEKLKVSTNDFNEDVFESLDKEGRLLGSGAFGKVFLATGILQEPVAVKKILLGNVEVVNADDRVTKQFINEVEVLSKYRHKNLVSLLGFSCDGCTYCLLYDYISGGTLKDRLQSEDAKLTWQERLSIALGTANAITYLHTAFSSPLIHRDVKTANILLDQLNKPKLGDFGITTLLDNHNMNTCTVIGTSAYMAPEAMRGDISVKCDTFSFGVVLLELLTSLPPFNENRSEHDLISHIEEKCESSITPLLDTSVGTWSMNDVNFGDEIFSIACQCIEEKRKRPVMVDVTEMLMIIVSKL